MEFCQQCDNMVYMRIDTNEEDSSTSLVYYCKHCGFERQKEATDSSCVYEMDYKTSNYAIHSVLNEYTHADPTLPRVDNIDCPNKECESQTHPEKKEVAYIKYDQTNMKYVYLCILCRQAWKIIGVDKKIEEVEYDKGEDFLCKSC